ncbi:MAG: putative phosphorylase, family 1 [Bryobacterales bacterium]|nr:putative phosphorylase, family 1 [Bryobacterales bacterium]
MDIADILFIASDPREFTGTMRFWRDVRPIALPVQWAREGLRKGKRVLALANGAGAGRARMAANAARGRVVCNIGFCGALDPALRVGDIVVPGVAPVTTSPFTAGGLICSDRVVATVEQKRALRAQGGTAVDMESAGLPGAYFVKSVSDLADESFDNDFNAALLPDGRFSVARLIGTALQKPFVRFPELVRLRQRTQIASEKLGEFIDTCEF